MYHNYIEEYNIAPDEVIVYLRKSRADDPLLTVEEVLARHESIVDEWSERNLGDRVPEKNKFREVVSGETIEDRIEIQRVLKMIESPKYKAILVVEVQRLSRGDLEDCGKLMKLIRYTNTLVITPQKIYDLADEYDRDMFERELKRGNEYLEYVKKIMQRGTLRSVSEGNYLGSIPPYGYSKITVSEGKIKYPTLAVKEDEANVVRMIFDLYVNKDMGMTNICRHLDSLGIKPRNGEHWSSAAIREMIANIHYIGKVKRNWRKTVTKVENGEILKSRPKSNDYLIYDGKHEAIISEELFNAAQAKRGRNHRAKANTKVRNPFAGLVYCQCGRAMTLRGNEKDGKSKNALRLLCDNQVHCKTGSCTFDQVLSYVRSALEKNIDDFEFQAKSNSKATLEMHRKIIASLENKLHDLESKELAQWEAQADPDPNKRMPQEIFKKLNEKLLKEKEETRTALLKARQNIPNVDEIKSRIVRFRNALEALDDPTVSAERKNSLLKNCIQKITYSRERPTREKNSSKVHGGWSETPIVLDITLRV